MIDREDRGGSATVIRCVAFTHHSAGPQVLNRLAVPSDELSHRVRRYCAGVGAVECFLLSTCNRFEIYLLLAARSDAVEATDSLLAQLAADSGIPMGQLSAVGSVLDETAAISHLNAVACGLDSMVIGEHQVVAQLKHALGVGLAAGTVGPVLGTAVRGALQLSKAVRSTLYADTSMRSLVAVGLELAAAAVGGLTGRAVLIIGAGRTGKQAAELLQGAGAARVDVANRTVSRADSLAVATGGTGMSLADAGRLLDQFDVVISATGCRGLILDRATIADAMLRRPERPLFLVDLAVPPDVDPDAAGLPGVETVTIDDLGRSCADAPQFAVARQAWKLVEQGTLRFLGWRREQSCLPAIGALRAVASKVIDAEVRRLDGRLGDLDVRTRQEAHVAVHRAVNKLLHIPTVRVRELAGQPAGQAYVHALGKLFDLDLSETAS